MQAVARKVAAVENCKAAMVTSSGMAAISTTLLTLLGAGDHFLVQESLYGGSEMFLSNDLPSWGISFTRVNADKPETWQQHLQPNTKVRPNLCHDAFVGPHHCAGRRLRRHRMQLFFIAYHYSVRSQIHLFPKSGQHSGAHQQVRIQYDQDQTLLASFSSSVWSMACLELHGMPCHREARLHEEPGLFSRLNGVPVSCFVFSFLFLHGMLGTAPLQVAPPACRL